jgi:hypothetical protein
MTPRIFWRLDSIAFWRNGSAVICIISAWHFVQALMMIFYPSAVNPSSLLALQQWAAFGVAPLSVPWLVAVMLASVVLAVYGSLFRIGRPRLGFFVPQQWLLSIMGWGGLYATLHRAYLDGTPIPSPQIFNDQSVYITVFLIHIWAMGFRSRHA